MRWTKGRHGTTTALVFVTSGVAGCGQEPATDTQAFEVRDSAGVTIYENLEGEWTEATADNTASFSSGAK